MRLFCSVLMKPGMSRGFGISRLVAPSSPGSFDFRMFAWFDGLGAVGYSRTPIMAVAPPQGGVWWAHRARMSISAAIQDRVGGQAGAVASALMTGDRSGIAEETNAVEAGIAVALQGFD